MLIQYPGPVFQNICHWPQHMWKVIVKVAQSCPTLCEPMECIVLGILQARIVEWVAFPFSSICGRLGSIWKFWQNKVQGGPPGIKYKRCLDHCQPSPCPLIPRASTAVPCSTLALLTANADAHLFFFFWLHRVLVAQHKIFHCGTWA